MREPVSDIDLALLHLESPTNLMVVTGVLLLGRPVTLDTLWAILETRLLQFRRFRQRVAYAGKDGDTPCWEDAPDVDPGYHLQRLALPSPGDDVALQEVVSQLVSTSLDPDRPLWQFYLVEPYCGTGCAVVCRVHHCVADGGALVHVLLGLTDTRAGETSPVPPAPSQPVPVFKRAARPRTIRARLGGVRRAGRGLVRTGLRLAAHPSHTLQMAERGAQAVLDIGALAISDREPDTAFVGIVGVSKRVAWSPAIPLDDVKAIGRRLGGTVNDVLLATVSGAMRRYLLAHGEDPDGLEVNVAVPVSLRTPGTEAALGNQVGAFLLLLPVGLADPAERLRVIKKRMDHHKNSMEAPVIMAGLKAMGILPAEVGGPLADYFSSRLTAVMTNVPGPRVRLYLSGVPVDSFMFWVPKVGSLGLGVSFVSYAGDVRLGIISDAGLVPDPEAVTDAFQAEFRALLAQAEEVPEPVSLRASLAMLDDALLTLEAVLNNGKDLTE